MLVPGWCTQCRKVTQVLLSTLGAGPVPAGLCAQCDAEKKAPGASGPRAR